MTPVFCCGFECGQAGSVGQHWALSGTGAFSTTTVRSGLRSQRLNPTAGASNVTSATLASSQMWIVRCYIQFATLPNVTTELLDTGQQAGVYFKQSDSKIYAGSSAASLGATGVAVTTGVWYRIDCKLNSTANPWLLDVSVDGTSCGQASVGIAASSGLTTVRIGNSVTAATFDMFVDDVIISQSSGDYPIGVGKVMGYVPNADGTHTAAGTTTVKGTIAAPTAGGAITAATTDAFNWVNGRPLLGGATDNTRLINAQTAAATTYVEVAFEDSVEDRAPRSVEVITADRQASTAAGDMIVKINDNGTESAVLTRSAAAGVITDRFVTKQYALSPTGGAWNLNANGAASFQNIRARFGYSGDATPDQYWRGIMIEAEYDTTAIVVTVKNLGLLGVG